MSSSIKKFLFWYSRKDNLKAFDHSPTGELFLIVLNYSIWIFFFIISYYLIAFNINFFGRIFLATLIAEIIERYLKKKCLWPRPMFKTRDDAPKGLVNNWYQSGSFPSGHTMKATYFFLFLLFTPVFPLPLFLLVTIPLLTFRVIAGFHYPIDMIGGLIFGIIVWFLTKDLFFFQAFNNFISVIFNFVFLIK